MGPSALGGTKLRLQSTKTLHQANKLNAIVFGHGHIAAISYNSMPGLHDLLPIAQVLLELLGSHAGFVSSFPNAAERQLTLV